jgi:hypothetical protein
MTDNTHVDETKKISPKVIAGILTGLAIAAIGGIIAAVTPDTFSAFGAWGPIVYSLVTVGGAQLAAYLKSDPLRSNAVVLSTTATPVASVPEAEYHGDIPAAEPFQAGPIDTVEPKEPEVTVADQVAGH